MVAEGGGVRGWLREGCKGGGGVNDYSLWGWLRWS